jgi:uncharacterized protein (TIGR02001 family)
MRYKQMHRNILPLTLVALAITTSAVMADAASPLSFNVGVVSNYMWRGVTQSANHAAVQGGIDFADDSGFSLGTWASSLDGKADPSYEWDIYAGFGKTVGDFSYNLSLAYYAYPDVGHSDFSEFGVSSTWKMFTVGLAYTLDGRAPKGNAFRAGDLYYYGGLSFDLPMDVTLTGTLGHYAFDTSDTPTAAFDYTHWQIALSKDFGRFGEFSASYDQNDGGNTTGQVDQVATNGDAHFSVGWKKTF